MNIYFKKTILALCCSATLLLTACNDDKDDVVLTPPASSSVYVGETAYVKDKLDNAASISVMTYNMENVAGKMAKATAMVIYPKTAKPKDGWRVVVWEHGTVGVGDSCAPSNNALSKNFAGLAEELLAKGYVIVAPDYEGLGTAGIHPYLNLISESKSALAAVAAFKEKYADQLNGAWMSVGQSQGGQASIGTAEYANTDATYKGAVAGAPASSLGTIILQVAPAALKQIEVQENQYNVPLKDRNSVQSYATLLSYAALTGIGIKAYEPRFEYHDIFQERSKPLATLGEGTTGENGLCLQSEDPEASLVARFQKDIIDFMQSNPGGSVLDYPGLDVEKFEQNESIKKFLVDSQPGTKRIDKPVLILQGKLDTNVPYVVTQAMVKNLKELGSPDVELILVENASHTQAIVFEQQRLLKFVQQHMPAS